MTTGKSATRRRPPAGKAAPTAVPARRKIAAALARPPGPKRSREILVLELRRLRALFLEIAERYVANVEGKAAAMVRSVEERSLPAATATSLLREIRELAVKPEKGRRKDLARIERKIESVGRALES